MRTLLRPRRARRAARRNAAVLGATAASAAAGFGLLSRAVGRRDTADVDQAMLRRARLPEDHPGRAVADAVHPVGKWWVYVPAAVGVSAWLLAAPDLRRRGGPRRRPRQRLAGAAAVTVAAGLAAGLGPVLDRWLPQPPAPPGHEDPDKEVFPSGHTLGAGVVAMAGAWVLTREGLAPLAVAVPVALALPVLGAGSRLVVERHWPSDVLGGLLAATAVAAGCLAGYEAVRRG